MARPRRPDPAQDARDAGLALLREKAVLFPLLWNVAGDFLINAWLIDMGVGTPPALGLLHDVALAARANSPRCAAPASRISECLLERFTLNGRGGTVLQPGVDCLSRLAQRGEFPRQGSLAIDYGWRVRRRGGDCLRPRLFAAGGPAPAVRAQGGGVCREMKGMTPGAGR